MALLELRGVSKTFPGVQALYPLDLDFQRGEVHALIGENGAGKSTLIKLLSGVYRPDNGSIRFDNVEVEFASPQEAQHAGIRTVYQEFNLLPQLTVTENIFLGSEPRRKWLPLIDWPAMYRRAQDVLKLLEVNIRPEALVRDLTVAEQQMVELAKTLHVQAKLLILDEPTASLSQREVETMFRVIRLLKARGIGVIYISHRLNEILAIADRVTILRDGRHILTTRIADSTADQLIRLMSGRAIAPNFRRLPLRQPSAFSEVLRVENLTRAPAFRDISFILRAGEIIGLAGLVGSGRSALVRAIFGFQPADSGTIYIDRQPVSIHSPQAAIALGIGLLPEDREQQALLLEMTARENISLAALRHSGPLINPQNEANLAEEYIQRLRIKVSGPEAKARNLSGGTQQKIVLSRWLAVRQRILIFDEPTRGIDVAAKIEIYRLLSELARQGAAILIVSSELSEIVKLCDRALVMNAGRLITTLDGNHITEEALTRYIMGNGGTAI